MGKIFYLCCIYYYMKPQKMSDDQLWFLYLIGMEIKNLRIRKKLSYEKMAEEIGIARNTYNLLEHGKINFQFSTLQLVLIYHGISFSKFFKSIEKEAENWIDDEILNS